jgi:putative Holliday junction resolvase
MRVMGLDYGDKTIGIAVSDPLGYTAQGIEVIKRTNWANDITRIKELLIEYTVERIVIGFPKNMNNTVGPKGEAVLKFKEKLEKEIDIAIDLFDERLTTAQAEKLLISGDVRRDKRKKVIDKLAAVLILQSYLYSLKKGG